MDVHQRVTGFNILTLLHIKLKDTARELARYTHRGSLGLTFDYFRFGLQE